MNQNNTGMYKGLIDSRVVPAFLLQHAAGLIGDRFLRLVGNHINDLNARITELEAQAAKPKPKTKKKEADDAS